MRIISSVGMPRRRPSASAAPQKPSDTPTSFRPMTSSCRSRGVEGVTLSATSVRTRPSSVRAPVSTTTPSPDPSTTVVPA